MKVIGAVYRPGSASGHGISLLQHLDVHARRHGSHVLIAGDFNVHRESWLGSSKTTPAGEYTEELGAVHGLQQHVQCATWERNRLDLVLSDLEEILRVSIKPTNPIDLFVKWRPAGLTGQLFAAAARIPRDPI